MTNNKLTTLALDVLTTVTGGKSFKIQPQLASEVWKSLGKGDAGPSSMPRSQSYGAGTVICENQSGTPVCTNYPAK